LSDPEQEVGQKPSLNLDSAERRNSLFAYLGHAIRLSHEKMSSRGNSHSAKQSWGRFMVSVISAYELVTPNNGNKSIGVKSLRLGSKSRSMVGGEGFDPTP
jgi:hypothetical protein